MLDSILVLFRLVLQQHISNACVMQVEHSAGLFQRVTKGLLDDTFGQLKEVSAMFAKRIRDASRRSCGVQASQQPPDAEAVAVQAVHDSTEQLLSGQREQLLHDEGAVQAAGPAAGEAAGAGAAARAVRSSFGQHSQDAFELEERQTGDGAGWSAVLPQDETHPVLHFQALLRAEQAAAAAAAAAIADDADASSALEVSDAARAAAAKPGDSVVLEVSDVGILDNAGSSADMAAGSTAEVSNVSDEGRLAGMMAAAAAAASTVSTLVSVCSTAAAYPNSIIQLTRRDKAECL